MALSDDDFAELQQQAVSARETAQTLGWEIIMDRVRHQIGVHQKVMIGGSCKSWEDYQDRARWLDCALWVLEIPNLIEAEVETHRELRAEGL